MTASIIEIATTYQQLSRQQKELENQLKPLKEMLTEYAENHKSDFDEAFQLKFPNGSYISLRVKDIIEGDKKAKEQILSDLDETYIQEKLDETTVLKKLTTDAKLRKLLTKHNLKIVQKETYAVYAG